MPFANQYHFCPSLTVITFAFFPQVESDHRWIHRRYLRLADARLSQTRAARLSVQRNKRRTYFKGKNFMLVNNPLLYFIFIFILFFVIFYILFILFVFFSFLLLFINTFILVSIFYFFPFSPYISFFCSTYLFYDFILRFYVLI